MVGKVTAAILISGRGSNMASLLRAARADDYPVRFTRVIANRDDAAGLSVAADMGVPVSVVSSRAHPNKREFERSLNDCLQEAGAELVVCAGFMVVLSADFCRRWRGRVLNIHPSLLPKYRGLNTHARVLAAGDKVSGCTVHLVTAQLDAGKILARAEVPVLAGDDEPTLAARVLEAEHSLLPQVVAKQAARLARWGWLRRFSPRGLLRLKPSNLSNLMAR